MKSLSLWSNGLSSSWKLYTAGGPFTGDGVCWSGQKQWEINTPPPLPSRDLSKLVCVPSPIASVLYFQAIKESLLQVEEGYSPGPSWPTGGHADSFYPLGK